MKISDILASGQKPFPSIEIVPPLRGVSKKELLDAIRPFMAFNPPFINVTCHRDDSERADRDRVSQTAVCCAVQDEFKKEIVPHIICGGASSSDIRKELFDFRFLGIENILALRGDHLKGETRFTPAPDGYSHASELVSAIRRFGEENSADFCIGVAGYPEKHFEARDLESDIDNLKRKVDAGADFIITQMFFDNGIFFRFRDMCLKAGITVPIIPGIKPLSKPDQIISLPRAFSLHIPDELAGKMEAGRDDPKACYEIGAEWGSAQCEDLLRNGVPAIHFYTMGRQDNILEIIKNFFPCQS